MTPIKNSPGIIMCYGANHAGLNHWMNLKFIQCSTMYSIGKEPLAVWYSLFKIREDSLLWVRCCNISRVSKTLDIITNNVNGRHQRQWSPQWRCHISVMFPVILHAYTRDKPVASNSQIHSKIVEIIILSSKRSETFICVYETTSTTRPVT